MSPDEELTVDLREVVESVRVVVQHPTLWRRIRWAVGDALASLTHRCW